MTYPNLNTALPFVFRAPNHCLSWDNNKIISHTPFLSFLEKD